MPARALDDGVVNLETFVSELESVSTRMPEATRALDREDAFQALAGEMEGKLGGLEGALTAFASALDDSEERTLEAMEDLAASAHDLDEGRGVAAETNVEHAEDAFEEGLDDSRGDLGAAARALKQDGLEALEVAPAEAGDGLDTAREDGEGAVAALAGSLEEWEREVETAVTETAALVENSLVALEADETTLGEDAASHATALPDLLIELEAECAPLREALAERYASWMAGVEAGRKALVEAIEAFLDDVGHVLTWTHGHVEVAPDKFESLLLLSNELANTVELLQAQEATMEGIRDLVPDLTTARSRLYDIDEVLRAMDGG